VGVELGMVVWERMSGNYWGKHGSTNTSAIRKLRYGQQDGNE